MVPRIDTANPYHSLPSPSGHRPNAHAYHAIQHPTEIVKRVYLADLSAAENPETLSHFGITHVLSVMPGKVSLPPNVPLIAFKQIPLRDAPFEDLISHLPEATAFIRTALYNPNARVLVHCVQGISRSASVVCAFLIEDFKWSPDMALAHVKKLRPCADPNLGFLHQLNEYATKLSQGKGRP